MSEIKLDSTGLKIHTIQIGDSVLSSEGNKLLLNGEDFTSSSGGHNIGEQWISMDGTIPFGGVPFNGQVLNIADYQDLYNWAKDNGRVKTESEWQTLKTNNNSNVSYYSDYSDTQFRMPLFRGYLKANQTGGGYTKEGLPNITGSLGKIVQKSDGTVSGAFSKSSTDTSVVTGSGTSWVEPTFSFKASSSNSIYGNSSHVTPETNTILVGVYAFNTVVNAAIFDANQEITNHLHVSTAMKSITIGYPSNDNSGALLVLRSVNEPNYPSTFSLTANNDTGYTSLTGRVAGDLTWGGKPVITLIASWRSGKNWYRKYSDGWIEQGGVINYGSSSGKWNKSVSLNTSFTNTNYNVVASFYEADSAGDRYHQNGINIISLTTSSFQVYQLGSDSVQYITWYACGY